jgi:biotin carboxylase
VIREHVVALKWDDGLLRLLAERRHVHVVVEADEEMTRADPLVLAAVSTVYRVPSLRDVEHLGMVAADLAVRGVRVSQVLSYMESTQYPGAVLAALLRARGPRLTVVVGHRDKRIMKQRLRAAHIATADFVSLPQSSVAPDLSKVAARLGLPCIVKPASGMGCAGTQRVDTQDALSAIVATADADPSGGHLIAESHQSGEELHVDAVWHEGHPIVLAVSRYLAPVIDVRVPGRDNASYLVRERDEPTLYRQVRELHAAVNQALDIADGVTHTELFRPADGSLVVSEVATRFAGSVIPEVVGLGVGRGLRETYVDIMLGTKIDTSSWEPSKGTLGWTTLSPTRAGTLTNVAATCDAVRRHPAVRHIRAVRRDGEQLDPWTNPSQANVVDLVLETASPADFRDCVLELERDFPLTVDPVPAGA